MGKICDLHTHSLCSDGTLAPAALAAQAAELGLGAVALTDHNTTAGLRDFLAAGQPGGPELVAGCELTTDWQGRELHLLGLFLRPGVWGAVEDRVLVFRRAKEESNRKLCAALTAAGLPVDYGALWSSVRGGSINRANVAAFMKARGMVSSINEAFVRYLEPGLGFYEPPARPDALETAAFLRGLGAVPVLAHPFLHLDEEDLEKFLPQARERGLCGMEVSYPRFTAEQTALAQELCRRFGILPSGGSDFHGKNKPDIALGRGRGELFVPMEFYEGLKEKAQSI